MSLRARILALISLLLAGSVLVTAAILSLEARRTMLEEQRNAGLVLARILARTAFIVEEFPAEVEDAIAQQMVIEAVITSHFVAAADAAGWTPDEINNRLADITAQTTLGEFWITDETGYAYLRNRQDIEFTFTSDASANPQSAIFYQLITGERSLVIQQAAARDYDGKIFKYVGVGGVDKPRIVQVGYEFQELERLRQRVSLERLSQELVATGDIRAVRTVDSGIQPRVLQAGGDFESELTALDIEFLNAAITGSGAQAYIEGDSLKLIEPILSADPREGIVGAVMVYLPTDNLRIALQNQVKIAMLAACGVLFFGVLGALFLARVVTSPLDALRSASTNVANGQYSPETLRDVIVRRDELGELGRVFDGMAREVSARDQRLQVLRTIIPVGVALSVEKDFNRLLETIVVEAQRITNADAGSLYLRTDQNELRFMLVRNISLGIFLGGTSNNPVTFGNVPMYLPGGKPNHNHIASYVALTGERVSVQDAYSEARFDLSGTHAFDKSTGYRSVSFLTLPLKDTADKVIGVLQLINAKNPKNGQVIAFSEDEVIDSLALITSAGLSAYIREEALRQEINKLRIEIDHAKQSKQVEEITESDYFQRLQAKVQKFRESKE
jgi:HAMP domain-containing protein